MVFEVLVAISIGVLFGIFTGLIPGIHVNLVAALLLVAIPLLPAWVSTWQVVCCVIALAVTHTFLDSIPSIFLGAPDAAMAAAVLPGHQLLHEGLGEEAVALTVLGSLFGLLGTVAIMPLAIPLVRQAWSWLQPAMPWVLLGALLVNVLAEKKKAFRACLVILLTGFLGVIVLLYPLEQPLFPLLSGLFGVSTLLLALDAAVPKQEAVTELELPKKSWLVLVAMVGAGSLTGLLPGLGAAHAAFLATYGVGSISRRAFLVLIGGINTVNFVFSLVTWLVIGKARNGAVVMVQQIVEQITLGNLLGFVGVVLFAGGIAAVLALWFAKVMKCIVVRVPYKVVCWVIIGLLAVLSVVFDGWWGLLVLVTATAAGMLSPLLQIRRTHAMACLMVPVIVFLL